MEAQPCHLWLWTWLKAWLIVNIQQIWASFPPSPPSSFFMHGHAHSGRESPTILSLSCSQSVMLAFFLSAEHAKHIPASKLLNLHFLLLGMPLPQITPWRSTHFSLSAPMSPLRAAFPPLVTLSHITLMGFLHGSSHCVTLPWWFICLFSLSVSPFNPELYVSRGLDSCGGTRRWYILGAQ